MLAKPDAGSLSCISLLEHLGQLRAGIQTEYGGYHSYHGVIDGAAVYYTAVPDGPEGVDGEWIGTALLPGTPPAVPEIDPVFDPWVFTRTTIPGDYNVAVSYPDAGIPGFGTGLIETSTALEHGNW